MCKTKNSAFGLRNVCVDSLVPYKESLVTSSTLDIVGTVYHLVIYMQSNKIHFVYLVGLHMYFKHCLTIGRCDF